MNEIISLDRSLFWWINTHHNTFLDWTLWVFSQHWSWAVIILAAYCLATLRHDRRGWLWVLTGVVLCFLLADQISNNAIKDGVQRLRPCHAMEGVRMFHTGKGGLYGFVSSHAANSFAIAMFFSLMYRKKRKADTCGEKRGDEKDGCGTKGEDDSRWGSRWMTPLMFAWAFVVCYSRSYLGKHYPGDLVGGAILGLGVGAAVYFAISRIRVWITSRRVA